MITVSEDQFSQLSGSVEQAFAEKLRSHLEQSCPGILPKNRSSCMEYVESCIARARETGLTWESTIAEFARLVTLRQAGKPVVDPVLLAGSHPAVADACFAEEMRRTKIIGHR